MSKSKAAVDLGKRRAANLTALDRSTNARTGWRRKYGPDHITTDQWRVLSKISRTVASHVRFGSGQAGSRFWAAVRDLTAADIISIMGSSEGCVSYQRGPKWVAQKHIRVASE